LEIKAENKLEREIGAFLRLKEKERIELEQN